MFGIFDKIEEFFRELLLGGIKANLESMFLDINDKVGAVATDVGKTPMGWNGDVFAFIKSINDSVIIPIAGLIITAVLSREVRRHGGTEDPHPAQVLRPRGHRLLGAQDRRRRDPRGRDGRRPRAAANREEHVLRHPVAEQVQGQP